MKFFFDISNVVCSYQESVFKGIMHSLWYFFLWGGNLIGLLYWLFDGDILDAGMSLFIPLYGWTTVIVDIAFSTT